MSLVHNERLKLTASFLYGVVAGRRDRPACGSEAGVERVEAVNSLELYLIIAPLALGALGLAYGWWVGRS